jgi:hypothetical protein
MSAPSLALQQELRFDPSRLADVAAELLHRVALANECRQLWRSRRLDVQGDARDDVQRRRGQRDDVDDAQASAAKCQLRAQRAGQHHDRSASSGLCDESDPLDRCIGSATQRDDDDREASPIQRRGELGIRFADDDPVSTAPAAESGGVLSLHVQQQSDAIRQAPATPALVQVAITSDRLTCCQAFQARSAVSVPPRSRSR